MNGIGEFFGQLLTRKCFYPILKSLFVDMKYNAFLSIVSVDMVILCYFLQLIFLLFFWGRYVEAQTLMNNYAHIFDLLTRLRQVKGYLLLIHI
jgi:hypothetical protein